MSRRRLMGGGGKTFDYVVNTNQGTPDVYFDGVYVGTVSGGKLTVSYPYKEEGYTVTLQNCTVPASTEKYLVDELFIAAPDYLCNNFKNGLFGICYRYSPASDTRTAYLGVSYYKDDFYNTHSVENYQAVLCAKKQKTTFSKKTTGTITDSITLNYTSKTTYTIHQVKANDNLYIMGRFYETFLDPDGTGEDYSRSVSTSSLVISAGSRYCEFPDLTFGPADFNYWEVDWEFTNYSGNNPESSFSFNDGVKDYTGKLNIRSNKHFLDPNKYGGIIYL